MNASERIVAEVTVTWPKPNATPRDLLGKQFEQVIATNLERGYLLESWQLAVTSANSDEASTVFITETIVAVFVKGIE